MIVLIILIIIALIVSTNNTTNAPSLDIGTTINIEKDELKKFLANHHNILNSAQEFEIPNMSTNNLGLYNISVLKTLNGYSGIIRGSTWNGCCRHNISPAFSYVYYIDINEDASIKNLKRIELDYNSFNRCVENISDVYANGIEDSRIFIFKGEEWAIGNILGAPQQSYPCANAMCIFKISDPISTFKILIPPPNIDPKQRQKNWSPFEYNDELYCEYSIEPHIILKINVNTGLTEQKWHTGTSSQNICDDNSLRGGAPPILITNPLYSDNISKNHLPELFYIGIGHTRNRITSDYLHFFYIFESEPPFKILKITPRFKLYGNERIQFAAGISYYQNMLYVSYGVDDCYNRISKFNINDIIHILQ